MYAFVWFVVALSKTVMQLSSDVQTLRNLADHLQLVSPSEGSLNCPRPGLGIGLRRAGRQRSSLINKAVQILRAEHRHELFTGA